MDERLHTIEVIVDKSIPYALCLLVLILIAEFFFHKQVEPYTLYLEIADAIIITVFIADLVFKYIRVRNIPKFIKSCWLEIIAVFPFFLIFRLIEYFGSAIKAGEIVTEGQAIFHGSMELEKEAARIIEAAEKSGEGSRLARLRRIFNPRIMRPLLRSPRLLKIVSFYERPTGNHHIHEESLLKPR